MEGHVEEHVEGHDFSRAVRVLIRTGFSRCGSALDEPSLSGMQFVWDGHSCPSLLMLMLVSRRQCSRRRTEIGFTQPPLESSS